MTKLGRKVTTINGDAKVTYANKLPTDVVAFLRGLPNAAEWLEEVIRLGMKRANR